MARKNTNATVLEMGVKLETRFFKQLESQVSKALAPGIDKAFGPDLQRKITKTLYKSSAEMKLLGTEILAIQGKMRRKGITDEAKQQLRNDLKRTGIQYKAQEKRFKTEAAHIAKLGPMLKKAHAFGEKAEAFGAGGAKIGEEIGETAAAAFEGNLSGVFAKLGAGVKGLGMAAVQQQAKGGAGAGAMGAIGGVLTKIGPALMAIGAIAAGFAAIAKIIIDADAAVKELNKAILDGGVGVGDLADKYGDVDLSVRAVTASFADAWSLNRKWGTTAKDHLEILGGYAEAGLTMKEIARGTRSAEEAMTRYQDATEKAMVYSKIFGTGAKEMAENMGSWMEDLGGDLDNVANSLSAIHVAAMDSGFSTKRFYGILQTATSGMSMYNVRLSEAASMLATLGKYLGVKKGGEFLQTLGKGFSDMGMQDRIKMIKTTGEGRFRKGLAGGAEAAAGGFMGMKGAQQVLEAAGLGGATKENLVETLAKMSPAQQAAALSQAEKTGNADLVRQLSGLMEIARGAKGGMGAQMLGMGRVDMITKMAMTLDKLKAIPGVGDQAIYKVEDPAGLVALESLSGFSGEQLMEFRELSKRFEGGLEDLQARARKGEEDISAELVKTRGVVLQDGKVLAARWNEEKQEAEPLQEIKTVADLMRANEETLKKEAHEQLPQDIRLAEQTAKATTEVTKILEQGVEYWLISINDLVEQILNWMPGSGQSEREERQATLDKQAQIMQQNRKEIGGLDKSIIEWQEQMQAETTPKGRAGYKEKIEAAEKRKKVLADQMMEAQEIRGRVQRGQTVRYKTEETPLLPNEQAQWDKLVGKMVPAWVKSKAPGLDASQILGQKQTQLAQLSAENAPQAKIQAATEEVVKWQKIMAEALQRLTDTAYDELEASSPEEQRALLTEDRKRTMALKQQREKKVAQIYEDATVRALEKVEKDKAVLETAKALMGTGVFAEDALKQAVAVHGGTVPEGMTPAGALAVLQGGGGGSTEMFEQLGKIAQPAMAAAHDWVARGGPGGVSASRIDAADVVTAAKPGGALSKVGAGGGRAVTNVYHLYNDGPGVMAAIKRAQSAGMLQ